MRTDKSVTGNIKQYYSILSIAWYILLFTSCAVVLFLLVMSILKTTSIHTLNMSFHAPGMSVKLPPEAVSLIPSHIFIIISFMAALSLALVLFCFHSIRMAAKDLAQGGSPFSIKTVKRIKYIGVSFIIYAILQLIGEAIISAQFLEPSSALQEKYGLVFASNITIPITPILIGIMIIGLAEIFLHGFKLQEENNSFV